MTPSKTSWPTSCWITAHIDLYLLARNDQLMSTSSLGEKVLTLSALLAAAGTVSWVAWSWLKAWWAAVNYP